MHVLTDILGVAILGALAFFGIVNQWLWFAIMIGLIPAAIARGKGSSAFFSWWAFGALAFIIALPAALMRRNQTVEDLRALAQSIEANTRPTFAARAVVDTDSSEGPDRNGNYPSWIAGLHHRPAETLSALRRIRSGEMLALKRNALDTPDPHAVEIYWQGRLIGYVPARHSPWVSERLDNGRPVSIFVRDVALDEDEEIDRIGTVIRTRPIG